MAKEKWTPDSVPRVLMHPAYVLTDPSVVLEEKWIEANVKLIREHGGVYLPVNVARCPAAQSK